MCIAIYKPEGKKISKKVLKRCYDANPDGAGFMFAEDKELHLHKGYFKFDEFYKEYKPHEKKQTLIHFRIKTHGKLDKKNCHPFLVNNSLGFIHNGIISGYGDDKLSDTIQFNEAILKKIVAKHGNMGLFDDPMVELIENVIGYSKLVFLDRHGNFNIMNEEKGHWYNGVWYSNDSHKERQATFDYYKGRNWNHSDVWQDNKKQDTLSLGAKAPESSSLAPGDFVELKEDYVLGDGDQTIYLKHGDWFEIKSIEGDTCTLVDSDLHKQNIVYPNIKCSDLEDWSDKSNDIQEVTEWNQGFYKGK